MYKDGNSTNIVAHDQGLVKYPKSDWSDQDTVSALNINFSAFISINKNTIADLI